MSASSSKPPVLNDGSDAASPTKLDFDFVKRLYHLDKLSPNVYEARFLGSGSSVTGNVYGGLIFAQSIAAAEKTVDLEKFTPHAVQGFFILNGIIGKLVGAESVK